MRVQHVCGAALLKFAAGAACVKAGRAVAPAAGSALRCSARPEKLIHVGGGGDFFVIWPIKPDNESFYCFLLP